MLLVFLRAVMAARERQDKGISALQLAEPARCARVIQQLIIEEDGPGHELIAHD